MSWVEEDRQEALKKEASKTSVSFLEDPIVGEGFASVTKDAAILEDRRLGFASVTEGASSQMDWAVGFTSMIEEASS